MTDLPFFCPSSVFLSADCVATLVHRQLFVIFIYREKEELASQGPGRKEERRERSETPQTWVLTLLFPQPPPLALTETRVRSVSSPFHPDTIYFEIWRPQGPVLSWSCFIEKQVLLWVLLSSWPSAKEEDQVPQKERQREEKLEHLLAFLTGREV